MTLQCLLLLLPLCTLVAAADEWDRPNQQVVMSVHEGFRYPSYKFTNTHPGYQGDYHMITSENTKDGDVSYLQAYSYSYNWSSKDDKQLYYGGFNKTMTVCQGGRNGYLVTAANCQRGEEEVFKFYVSSTNEGEFLPQGLSYKHYKYAICERDSYFYSRITTYNINPCHEEYKVVEDGDFYAFSGEILCPERPIPDNAYLNSVDSDGVFNKSITYICSNGFTMNGPATITCNEGHWSGSPSCSIIECDQIRQPDHGRVIVKEYKVNSIAIFHCNPGYRRVGADTLRCVQQDQKGHWSPRPIPYCEIIECDHIHQPDHGRVMVNEYKVNSTAIFHCNPGYRRVGADTLRCVQQDQRGYWSPRPIPYCEIIECDQIRQPDHGRVMVNEYKVNSTAIFHCHPGYRRVGADILRCVQQDQRGHWSPRPLSYCEKLNCTELEDPENGDVSVMGYDHGHTAKYMCLPGYNIKGTEIRKCHNGQWDGEQPICQAVTCRDPGMLKHGERLGNTFQYGSILTYECDSGYTMTGSKAQLCSETGQWEPRQKPHCEIVKCALLRNPESGSLDANGFEFNSTGQFKCNPGYAMEGESTVTCQDNGQWDISPPTCKACPIGYYKEGSNAETCQACPEHSTTVTKASHQKALCNCEEGSSGPSGGPCVLISCDKLSAPENGEMSKCGTVSGAECVFSCDPGFILSGQQSRRCTAQGWTGIQPICERCPKNMYKAGPQVTSCMPCPVNSVTGDRLGKSQEDCQCDIGYSSNEDGHCVDVNECEDNNGGCEQQCDNTPGSFQCSCSIPGYELHSNGINCTLVHSCKKLEQPVEHGHLRCMESREENGVICHIDCNDGFFFVSGHNDYITCGAETEWVWSHRRVNATARIPACTEEYYVDMSIFYTVNYTFGQPCEAHSVDYVQFMNKYQEIFNSIEVCQGKCFVQDISSTCATINRTSDHRISFQLFLQNADRDAVDPTCNRNCQRMNLRKIVRTYSLVSRVFQDLVNSTRDSLTNIAPMKPQSLRRIRVDLLCQPGMVLSKHRLCVPCDKGSYIPKQDMERCLPCPVGSYQQLKGQTKCERCSPGTNTLDVGAHDHDLCNQSIFRGQRQRGVN